MIAVETIAISSLNISLIVTKKKYRNNNDMHKMITLRINIISIPTALNDLVSRLNKGGWTSLESSMNETGFSEYMYWKASSCQKSLGWQNASNLIQSPNSNIINNINFVSFLILKTSNVLSFG
jgi:hypothetical protein